MKPQQHPQPILPWRACLFFFAALGFSTVPAAEAERTFHVAPDGNDAGPGTESSPFATLERARRAVRGVPRALRGDVRVVLWGGTYRFDRPVVFDPADSGAEGRALVYEARSGETPILSGGQKIQGWKRGEGVGDIWTAEIPEAARRSLRDLFVDGHRRERARVPADGFWSVSGAADAATSSWAGSLDHRENDEVARRSFRFRKGDLNSAWTNIDDVEVVVLQYWMAARLRIQAIDKEHDTVLFTGASWRPLTWSFGYYAENVFEGLDRPGTWYLNRRTGVLYYHALPGEDFAKAEVVAPALDQMVRFEGDVVRGETVHDITLRGLSFQHTSWALPAEGYAYPQAELPPPAAIHAIGARRLRIEGCTLSHMGGWAIELGRGSQDVAIVANTIGDVGAGCVKIGEPRDPGADSAEVCRVNVSDNLFCDGSKVYLGAPAIWVGQSSQNTVAHNEFSGQFMWAVSLGWNWSYFPLNRSRDNVVEKNHVRDLGTGILGTHAALYCLGVSPGTVLRNNYIHDVRATEAWGAGEGIILDNGCAGILVEDNVVHDADSGGWGCNFNCFGNVIINNIFVNGRRYQLTRYGDAPQGAPPPNGEVFARNIIAWKEGTLFQEKDWWSFSTLWNQNLYYRSGDEPIRFLGYSFDEWKERGLDRDSIIADPLFVNPEKHDYSLRPESPAFRLGFHPIDLSDVGPRKHP